jgi:hypothetical protein
VTLKHWLANSVEGGVGKFSRETMDAQISAYDLASTYLPQVYEQSPLPVLVVV